MEVGVVYEIRFNTYVKVVRLTDVSVIYRTKYHEDRDGNLIWGEEEIASKRQFKKWIDKYFSK